MSNSTGNADKKSTKTGKNYKTKQKRLNKKEKATQEKMKIQFKVIKQEVMVKERRLNSRKVKTIQAKENIKKTTKENSIN